MADESVPVIDLGDPEAERFEVLRAAQAWVVEHPVAAQGLFAAFVAEGRRYAATPEGAALRDRVARSDLARRGRVLWEVGTLNVLEEHPEGPLPGKVVEAMAQALATPDLERMLARLFALEA
jgi:hypothetical protein